MAPLTPSYEYQNDQIHAVFEGRVIASGTDFSKVSCDAVNYLEGLSHKREDEAKKEARRNATHISTPNGLKGQIISRVEGVWGDEITVRFENNEIRRFETTAGLKFSTEEPSAPANVREALQTVLDRPVDPSARGLTDRIRELQHVRQTAASHVAAERSLSEQRSLNSLIITAEAEIMECKEVLAHLEAVDAENATPSAPVYAAAEQAALGKGAKDNWLDVVSAQMIAESESQDLDKLLEEGPILLVSSLDQVHDAGVVCEIAANHILSKTAGFTGPEVEAYRESFVANAEMARRKELTYRQENVKKEAQIKQASLENIPDESLFL